MMYLKPENASPGQTVPDEGAQEAAQDMANDQWCRVLIFKETPLGFSIPVGTVDPVGEKKRTVKTVEVESSFGRPVAVTIKQRPKDQ